MKIAIYEDNVLDQQKLIECINALMNKTGIKYNIRMINSKKELFDRINNIDLLFLDIELDDENGIDLGLKIRESNKDCRIVIVSYFQKYLIEGYKIKAERYFIKPIEIKEFMIEMKKVINEYFIREQGFIDKKIADKKIYIKNIIMVEFCARHTILHCVNNEKFQTPYSLKYWLDKLKKYGFSQCYKSYLVNCQYVDFLDKIDVVLFDGRKVPISRHFREDFRADFINSIGNKV